MTYDWRTSPLYPRKPGGVTRWEVYEVKTGAVALSGLHPRSKGAWCRAASCISEIEANPAALSELQTALTRDPYALSRDL